MAVADPPLPTYDGIGGDEANLIRTASARGADVTAAPNVIRIDAVP